MKQCLQRILQEIVKKNNTWNIRHLVDESFVPANQRIILKIDGLYKAEAVSYHSDINSLRFSSLHYWHAPRGKEFLGYVICTWAFVLPNMFLKMKILCSWHGRLPWLPCKSPIFLRHQNLLQIKYIISFEVYDGFIRQKILKVWRQESWLFGPGWSSNITLVVPDHIFLSPKV